MNDTPLVRDRGIVDCGGVRLSPRVVQESLARSVSGASRILLERSSQFRHFPMALPLINYVEVRRGDTQARDLGTSQRIDDRRRSVHPLGDVSPHSGNAPAQEVRLVITKLV